MKYCCKGDKTCHSSPQDVRLIEIYHKMNKEENIDHLIEKEENTAFVQYFCTAL